MDLFRSVPHELRLHGSALRALAAALAGGGDADDLVQETALRALRAPPPRPTGLAAFFATILRNLARKQRRGERRRQERERCAARPEALPSAGELAARHDVLRRVSAAVFALAEPYRTTVLLRYVDDLTPSEIAAHTATPLATVKSRLQRGLCLLRDELDGVGRDQGWRVCLLAMADDFAGPRGLRAMLCRPVAGLLAAAALLGAALLGAAVWLLPGTGAPLAAPSTGASAGIAVAGAPGPRSGSFRESMPEAAAQEGSGTRPAAALAIVRGRCVEAETGKPIAGVSARFSGFPRNDGELARHGPVQWQDPVPVRTDAEGRFDIRFVPPPPYQHWLDLSAEGRAPRTARWWGFQTGQVEDLGDIAFVRGHEVRGKVVDPAGAPVARVSVALKNLPLPIAPTMGANDVRYGSSDALGEFRMAVPIPAGTWALDATGRGVKLVSPASVRVRPDRGAEPLTVVVRRMPSVTGVVIDEAGAPLNGIYLEMAPAGRAHVQRAAASRSDEAGRFEIFAVDDEPQPACLTVRDPGPCEPLPGLEDVAWGTRDLKLVLKRALSVDLTVVEKGSGKPVVAYAVCCQLAGPESPGPTEPRLGGAHPDGRVTIDKVLRGDNLLRVVPHDPALAPSELIRFTAAESPVAALRVKLVRRPSLAVRVVRARGTPVAGTVVELIRPATNPRYEMTPWICVPEAERMPEEHGGPVVLSAARTDADGRARLFGVAGRSDLVVRVRGSDHVPLLVTGVTAGVPGERPLAVEDGVAVRGQVVPPGVSQFQLSVTLIHAGQQQAPRRVAGDGVFEFTHLSRSDTILVLTAHAPADNLLIDALQGWNPTVELCRVQVDTAGAASGVVKVELDAGAWLPASLACLATLDGRPPESARVFLVGRRPGARWRHGPFPLDTTGRFLAPALLPGTYEAQLQVGEHGAGRATMLVGEAVIEIDPGSSLRQELLFKSR